MRARLALNALALALGAALLVADTDVTSYSCENDELVEPAYTYTMLCHQADQMGAIEWDEGELVLESPADRGATYPEVSVVDGEFDLGEVRVARTRSRCEAEPEDPEPVECIATCLNTVTGIDLTGGFVLGGVKRKVECASVSDSYPPSSFELRCFVDSAVDWSCSMQLEADR